jgi:hypothetical protein
MLGRQAYIYIYIYIYIIWVESRSDVGETGSLDAWGDGLILSPQASGSLETGSQETGSLDTSGEAGSLDAWEDRLT